ncbi:MAG: translation initiation factor IF-2, partial [Ignavibacteriales bacterium]|nr:translation initiation factor IF-2 [Ignavibacteriales bacterium]
SQQNQGQGQQKQGQGSQQQGQRPPYQGQKPHQQGQRPQHQGQNQQNQGLNNQQPRQDRPGSFPENRQPRPAATPNRTDQRPARTEKPRIMAETPLDKAKLQGLKIVGRMPEPKTMHPKRDIPVSDDNRPKPAVQSGVTTGTQADADKKKKRKKTKNKKKPETVTPDDQLKIKKKIKPKKVDDDEVEVDKNIKATMEGMEDSGAVATRAKNRKRKKKERIELEERREEIKRGDDNKIVVTEFIAVNELANLMGVSVGDVISKCISMGLMVSINQRLAIEDITLVADEFGFEIEIAKEYSSDALEDSPDDPATLETRSPVVTIMGHVDHGKTSLLDYIRQSNVVAGEAGKITQHIGAYKVILPSGRKIAFLDTPGHEAFTAMRARGAQVTDIVILVVSADDAVMPQTIEAINHAKAANVPMVVAMNKMDRPEANPEKIRQQLADRGVLVEEWGGKYQCVEISAKTGKNVDLLLEKILLEADVLDLKANPNREARGVIVESEIDKGRGITATILVQKGTLRVGDAFIAGIYLGRVRAMFNERGQKVESAEPSTPVQVLGLEGAPQAGDVFVVVKSEREARAIAQKRQMLKREQDQKQVKHITLDEISRQISIGGVKELPIIVKGDVDGSVEALADSFMKLSNEEVIVRVIHRGVGAITESDVILADASNAIIIGFHVRPNVNARRLAETNQVDIRIYNIIYDAINEVKSALEGLLSPIISEEVTSSVEVRETFKVPKVGTVAGCFVLEGKIMRNNKIRLIRDGIVLFSGELDSLKRFKDDVREVDARFECGLSIHNYNDLKVGDIIEAYKVVETKKKLH